MAKSSKQRLGEYLEARGLISREQLLRALRNQKVLGGRLGSCLLEIDAIGEQDLCRALADLSGCPCVGPEELRGIPDETTRLVPAKVAKRCLAIPFHATATQVKVALANVTDLRAQDEITFVVGRRVRWFAALELRIHEALEKYYGEECPSRHAKLLDRLNRSRYLWGHDQPDETRASSGPAAEQLQWDPRVAGAEASPGGPASPPRAAPAPGEPASQEIAIPENRLPEAAAASAVPSPPTTAARTEEVPQPISFEEAERRLLEPADRDDVANTLIAFAGEHFQRAVLFVHRRGEISPWRWCDRGVDADRLASFRARLQQPSIFVSLRESEATFRGALPPMPLHLELGACFDPPLRELEIAVVPINLRGRLVAALLVDPGPAGFAGNGLTELQRLMSKAAIAFELVIMRDKLRRA